MSTKRTPLLHLDAAENIFFQRQLELIEAGFYEKAYAERKARQFVSTGPMIPDGIQSVTYTVMDRAGQAKRIANAADDLPMANVSGTQASDKLWDYGMAFSYTRAEIAAAARGGMPLDAMRSKAARDALADKLDDIVTSGDSDVGTKGLLNLSGTHDVTSSLHAWSLASPTAAEILADLSAIVHEIPKQTKEVESAKRLILPTNLKRFLATTPRASTSDTTLLTYFLANHPGLEIMDWERCNGAGAASKDRIVAYDPSVNKVRLHMSVDLEVLPPEVKNFSYVTNMRMRVGGVIAYFPKSICYGDIALS
jgi:hypothetical protein